MIFPCAPVNLPKTSRRRTAVIALVLVVGIAFLFLVPVVHYNPPRGIWHCPANGCPFLRWASVTYWAFGVGATWQDVRGYSFQVGYGWP